MMAASRMDETSESVAGREGGRRGAAASGGGDGAGASSTLAPTSSDALLGSSTARASGKLTAIDFDRVSLDDEGPVPRSDADRRQRACSRGRRMPNAF